MTDHIAVLEEVVADIRAHCNPSNPESDDEVSAAYALAWADRITAAIALMRGQSETCAWQKDDDEWEGAHWDSACGEKYFFVEGGPSDNGHKFCHGCGKPLHIIEPKDPADEQ